MNQPARNEHDLQKVFVSIRRELERFVAYRVRSPELAEDIVSEVYLKLHRAEFGGTLSDARGYLFRMAANLAIDHQKASFRHASLLQERTDLFAQAAPNPEEQCVTRSDLQIVNAALAELPEKAREILLRSRVDELTHGEIAEKMDLSKSSVEKYVIRALRHCRDKLREADAALEPDEASARLALRRGETR